MDRRAYWATLVAYLAIAALIAWATIGKLGAFLWYLRAMALYGALAWLVGRRFEDFGVAARWGYWPVLVCGLGSALLFYVVDNTMFDVRYPGLMAIFSLLTMFGPLALALGAGAPRSRRTQ